VHHRLALTSLATATLLALGACGGGTPDVSPEAAKHPAWLRVSEIVCPSGGDRQGSVDERKVSCTDEAGHRLEATFYNAPVELDRRVDTFTCATSVKTIVGTDWIVPVVPDERAAGLLLDSGGINIC
jgi:hypothetical protein